MRRNRWRYRSALAAAVPAMLFVNIAAEATPPSPLTPHTIVATAQETDCGDGVWIDFPCWEDAVELTATEGVGGTAVIKFWSEGPILVNLTCVSFQEANYGDSVGHIFRASGTTEDGTKYYIVAEDDGQGYSYDSIAVTAPGNGACGTFTGNRRPWNWRYFYNPNVVIAP